MKKKKAFGDFSSQQEKEKQNFLKFLIQKTEEILLSKRQRARKKKVMFLKDIIDPCQKDVLYEIKSNKINHQIEYDMKFFGVGSSQASKD